MNKQDLINAIAKETGLTKRDSTAALDATINTIVKALSKDEDVQLIGFGKFEVRNRAARKGRNPQTGEVIQIPATKAPAFRAGKALKEVVKQ